MRSNVRDVESPRDPKTTRKRVTRNTTPPPQVSPKRKTSETNHDRKDIKKILGSNCYTNQIYDHKKRIKCHIWRVIQLILCGICFIYSVIAINKGFVRTEVPSSYLAIFLITSTALFGVVLIDIISLMYGRPYFWNSWIMIATCGLLFCILCAGLLISTEFSSKGFFVGGAVLFILTALSFLLDLLYLLKFLLYVPIYSECETILDSTDEATQFPSKIRVVESFVREPAPIVMAKITEDEESSSETEISPKASVQAPPVIWREKSEIVKEEVPVPAPIIVKSQEHLCLCDDSTSISDETMRDRGKSKSAQESANKATNFPTKSTLCSRSRQQRTKSAPPSPDQRALQRRQEQSSTKVPPFYRSLEYSHQNQRNQPIHQQYYQQFCWKCGQMHYRSHSHHCGQAITCLSNNNFNSSSTAFNNSQSAQSTYRFQLFVPSTQQLQICEARTPTSSSGVQTIQRRSTTPRKRSKDRTLEDYCKKVDKTAKHPPTCQCCYCKSPTKPETPTDLSDSDTSSNLDPGKAADDEYEKKKSDQVQLAAIIESDKEPDSDEVCACIPDPPQTLYVHSEVSFYKTSTSSKNKPNDASKQKKRQ